MDSLLRDLRYAFRMLTKAPAFTAIAVLSLAIGIGPNTAIFSMVNSVLLRAPEGRAPERLVDVYNRAQSGSWYFTGYWVVERLREDAGEALDGVAAWVAMQVAVDDGNGTPRPFLYELVTGNYFEVLGIAPAHGRFFLPEEDVTPGTHPVAVVSSSFFDQELGGDATRLGAEVRVNGRPYTVIGVAPQGFTGKAMPGVQADLWLPYSMHPHLNPGQENYGNLGITARVREDVPVARAVSTIEAVGGRIDADRKARGLRGNFALGAFPWTEIYLHPGLDGPVLAIAGLLLVVVGLVLLVACINLAGFLLARSADRRREVAVRLAMGATRPALARQLLVESLLLGLAGGAVGLALGAWTAETLAASLDVPIGMPVRLDIGLDGRVLAFTAGLSVLAGLVFGLMPALQASRTPVAGVLRDEGTGAGVSRRRVTLRALLVGGQMALSVILLVGAGLFVRSLGAATAIDPGFDTGPAAIVNVDGRGSGYESGEAFAPVLDAALTDLRARPGIRNAALTTRMPLDLGNVVRAYDVPGVEPPPDRDNHRLELTFISTRYFETMGIRLVEGRDFTDADRAGAPRVGIVSRALAAAFWPDGSALGRTLIQVGDPENPITVVGVAEDVKIWSLQEAPRPYLYEPLAQNPDRWAHLVVRGAAPPPLLARTALDALQAADPAIYTPRVASMEEHLSYILFLPRMAARLIGGFAILAFILSMVGLYGIVSYGVARRTREMGIRLSLGAEASDVVGLVVRGGLVIAGAGAILGILAALGIARVLERFLIGVAAWDPLTFLAVPALLLAIAAGAAFLPARRASRVDPVEALRAE